MIINQYPELAFSVMECNCIVNLPNVLKAIPAAEKISPTCYKQTKY